MAGRPWHPYERAAYSRFSVFYIRPGQLGLSNRRILWHFMGRALVIMLPAVTLSPQLHPSNPSGDLP